MAVRRSWARENAMTRVPGIAPLRVARDMPKTSAEHTYILLRELGGGG